MPYTPPAQQSPATSNNNSPAISRSSSYHEHIATAASAAFPAARPGLPRSVSSTAYMQKHRRGSAASNSNASSSAENTLLNAKQQPSSDDNNSTNSTTTTHQHHHISSSVRQSPPPMSDAPMPSQALLSPPDSAQGSDDDESHGRGRQLENLAELQEAVRRSIDVRKEGSPDRSQTSDLMRGLSLITPPFDSTPHTPHNTGANSRGSLTPEARKISHSRSSSENTYTLCSPSKQSESPVNTSDSEEGDFERKPPLLRKKSGELVKPALRPSSRRRYSSMPGTPTYSKAVHFNEDIEQVRHFLQVDRPIAVSAGSSPVETAYDDEAEYPFHNDEQAASRSTDWDLRLANFPVESQAATRDAHPVKVEKIAMSTDSKGLVGTVVCQNLAFQKHVVARFTLDYWKTTSEIVAEYESSIRQAATEAPRDRFQFVIKLSDQINLESKTMLLCVRYNVNGQEYWDNNNNMNFQVDFHKKTKHHAKVMASGLGHRPLSAIPRSHKGSPHMGGGRPRSMPTSFDDDFTTSFRTSSKIDFSDSQPAPIRLKSKPKSVRMAQANEAAHGANAAFGTRYDFGASLSAALTSAQSAMGDRSGFDRIKKPSTSHYFQERAHAQAPHHPPQPPTSVPAVAPATAPQPLAQPSPKLNALSTAKPPQDSDAYNELIQKYCFFGSSHKTSSSSMTAAPASPLVKKQPQQPLTEGVTASSGDSITSGAVSSGPVTAEPTATVSFLPVMDGTYEKKGHLTKVTHTFMPRAGSPTPMTNSALSSRSTSPGPYGYPYVRAMDADFHQPTAIHG